MTIPDDDGFVSLLTMRAAAEPQRIYARFCGEPLTYAGLEQRSAAFAAHLRARGIVAGDRVAVMMRNSVATIAVVFGLARAGVAWVPVNAQQRGEGLRYLLMHSQPRLIVADAELVPQIDEAMASEAAPPLLTHAPGGELDAPHGSVAIQVNHDQIGGRDGARDTALRELHVLGSRVGIGLEHKRHVSPPRPCRRRSPPAPHRPAYAAGDTWRAAARHGSVTRPTHFERVRERLPSAL